MLLQGKENGFKRWDEGILIIQSHAHGHGCLQSMLWHRHENQKTIYQCPEDFEMLEFFAGKANLSRCMKLSGYHTGKLDIKYHNPDSDLKTNPMDLLSPAGFAFPRFVYYIICLYFFSCEPSNMPFSTTQKSLYKVSIGLLAQHLSQQVPCVLRHQVQ